jgi:hypothetical protein
MGAKSRSRLKKKKREKNSSREETGEVKRSQTLSLSERTPALFFIRQWGQVT